MKIYKAGLYTLALSLAVCSISGIMLFTGCKGKQAFQPTGDTIADGKMLVQKYCTRCHQEVEPTMLTRDVWKFHALPAMSRYIGLSTYDVINYYKKPTDTGGASLLEWQIMQAYFQKQAPADLPAATKPVPLTIDWAGFTLKTPQHDKQVDRTTMVAVNPATKKLYTGDVVTNKLTEWDAALKPRVVAELPSAPVAATFVTDPGGKQDGVFSCIGQILPVDFPNGKVMKVDLDGNANSTQPVLIQESLSRPVQTVQGDFNKDGLTDYVVLAQGHLVGGVYLLKQNADHSYTQSGISNKAGAAQAVVGDFNNDGWPDVMVLYGGGDEGLWMYLNDQKGGFTSKDLIHFPPVYGSTSFHLADINHDGKPDLIYTCGYNYKDSRILKPYHGLYIFTNEGDWKFKQTYFYPINGCTKAIAADFDGDGDLDIATVAFFADMKGNPAESFIYFEQDKPMGFKPHAIPVSKYGHWMCMDVADMNNDGKPDIILGNYGEGMLIQPGVNPSWDKNIPFIILENQTRK